MQLVIGSVQHGVSYDFDPAMRLERASFAAKLRAARAVLAMSQGHLAQKVGLTQKSVHRIEQGSVQPQLRTIARIQRFFCDRGIVFENLRDGGFRLIVDSAVLMEDHERDDTGDGQ